MNNIINLFDYFKDKTKYNPFDYDILNDAIIFFDVSYLDLKGILNEIDKFNLIGVWISYYNKELIIKVKGFK